ncbi:hypothetical protein L1887_05738 [Cichorium endivia]|nr:hypothetical protein L1887_05738 [Cichorium endivia]
MEMCEMMSENGSEGSEHQQLQSNVDTAYNEVLKISGKRSEHCKSDPSAGDASDGGSRNETVLGADEVGAGSRVGSAANGAETAPVTAEDVGSEGGTSPNGRSDCSKIAPGIADACNGEAQPDDGGICIETAPSAVGGGGGSNDGLRIDLNVSFKSDVDDVKHIAMENKDGAEGSSNVARGADAADGGEVVPGGTEMQPARKRMKSGCDVDEPPAMHEKKEEREVAEDGEGSASLGGGSSGGRGVEPPMQQPKYGIRLFGFDI